MLFICLFFIFLGKTSLHWAASVNNVAAAKVLLHHGANRDAQDNKVCVIAVCSLIFCFSLFITPFSHSQLVGLKRCWSLIDFETLAPYILYSLTSTCLLLPTSLLLTLHCSTLAPIYSYVCILYFCSLCFLLLPLYILNSPLYTPLLLIHFSKVKTKCSVIIPIYLWLHSIDHHGSLMFAPPPLSQVNHCYTEIIRLFAIIKLSNKGKQTETSKSLSSLFPCCPLHLLTRLWFSPATLEQDTCPTRWLVRLNPKTLRSWSELLTLPCLLLKPKSSVTHSNPLSPSNCWSPLFTVGSCIPDTQRLSPLSVVVLLSFRHNISSVLAANTISICSIVLQPQNYEWHTETLSLTVLFCYMAQRTFTSQPVGWADPTIAWRWGPPNAQK